MDFIKKHYEKALLGIVLLLAMAAMALLLIWIPNEKAALEEERNKIMQRPVKPLTNLDLSVSAGVMGRLSGPLGTDFGRPHNLVNPVQWQKGVDGRLIKLEKGNEIGPEAAIVTKTTPLYLVLTLDSVGTSSPTNPPSGYLIGLERQAAPQVDKRRKKQAFAKRDEKKEETFTLRDIKGPADNPTELVLELSDTGDRISLSKDKPYKRVDGYMADIRYDPEKRNFLNQRVDARFVINSERYKIVAITENEVVVLHELTGKKFTIRKKAAESQP
jgi:hypothetical protein